MRLEPFVAVNTWRQGSRQVDVPPLAPIVPPVSSIALPDGREERRRQPR